VLGVPVSEAVFAEPDCACGDRAASWFLFVSGLNIAQGSTELTDPALLERRMAQMPHTDAVDRAHVLVRAALRTGMPPCGGLSVGVERLLMAITGTDFGAAQAHPVGSKAAS
jgi:lysyl-tRNA synthetase class 2